MVELLLVLVILGLLAAVVVPKMVGRSEQARVTSAETVISSFETALDAFEVDNGYYPKGRDGLMDLFEEPREAKNWRGPYLKGGAVPRDPWDSEYIYTYPGKFNNRGYDIISLGPDGRQGGDDDITNYRELLRKR
jgi:general secretion pathway protein G